jgi:hypothetical protein
MENQLRKILGRKDSRALLRFMQERKPVKGDWILEREVTEKFLIILNQDFQEFLGYYKKDTIFSMFEKVLPAVSLHEFLVFWATIYNDRLAQKNGLKIKPIIERKDNGTFKNKGSGYGNSNRNKIRYPKKCRKTAWKRFYRLFPHLAKEVIEV